MKCIISYIISLEMENIKTLDQALRQSNIYFLIVLPFLKKRKKKKKN